MKLVTHT